jgi:hypothetical protein
VFVKWYLNSTYGILLEDEEEYTCAIMDHDINFVTLTTNNKIVIERDDYRVE